MNYWGQMAESPNLTKTIPKKLSGAKENLVTSKQLF